MAGTIISFISIIGIFLAILLLCWGSLTRKGTYVSAAGAIAAITFTLDILVIAVKAIYIIVTY